MMMLLKLGSGLVLLFSQCCSTQSRRSVEGCGGDAAVYLNSAETVKKNLDFD